MAKNPSKKPADQDPSNKAAGDDRNLVAIDEAYKEASLEDRLTLFWDKYQKPLILIAVLIIAFAIIWQVMAYIGERMDQRIRSEYAGLETSAERLDFAQQRSGHLLSGVAYLELADEAYGEGEFSNAIEYYQEAIRQFGEHELSDRARLGLGIALIEAGRSSEGRQALEELRNRSRALPLYREEATFALAVHAAEEGNVARARELSENLKNESRNDLLLQRAAAFVEGLE